MSFELQSIADSDSTVVSTLQKAELKKIDICLPVRQKNTNWQSDRNTASVALTSTLGI